MSLGSICRSSTLVTGPFGPFQLPGSQGPVVDRRILRARGRGLRPDVGRGLKRF